MIDEYTFFLVQLYMYTRHVHDGSLAHFKIDASVLDLKSERALYSHV